MKKLTEKDVEFACRALMFLGIFALVIRDIVREGRIFPGVSDMLGAIILTLFINCLLSYRKGNTLKETILYAYKKDASMRIGYIILCALVVVLFLFIGYRW